MIGAGVQIMPTKVDTLEIEARVIPPHILLVERYLQVVEDGEADIMLSKLDPRLRPLMLL